eukprot:GHVS01062147.1.p1 GENE.GHVS01062147.1~~GHVS01062147.1.p1  ORF type:complete len:135 (+),score=13.68 GHVS01062147.1:314-718(+)
MCTCRPSCPLQTNSDISLLSNLESHGESRYHKYRDYLHLHYSIFGNDTKLKVSDSHFVKEQHGPIYVDVKDLHLERLAEVPTAGATDMKISMEVAIVEPKNRHEYLVEQKHEFEVDTSTEAVEELADDEYVKEV